MSVPELATAVQHEARVVVLVVDNGTGRSACTRSATTPGA